MQNYMRTLSSRTFIQKDIQTSVENTGKRKMTEKALFVEMLQILFIFTSHRLI